MKRYVEEPGTKAVRLLLGDAMPAASRFSELEIVSALCRRCREGAFSSGERDRAIRQVREDFRGMSVVEITAAVVERGGGLLARHPLRAADALQLGSCLELQESLGMAVRFVAFDNRLRAAAQFEGLSTAP